MRKKFLTLVFIILLGIVTISFYIFLNPAILKKLQVVISPPIVTPTLISSTPTPICENIATSTIAPQNIITSEPALIAIQIDETTTRETLDVIFSELSDSLQTRDRVIFLSGDEIIADETVDSEWQQEAVSNSIQLLRHKILNYDFLRYPTTDEGLFIISKKCSYIDYQECIFVSMTAEQNLREQDFRYWHYSNVDNVDMVVIIPDCYRQEQTCQYKMRYWESLIGGVKSLTFVNLNEFSDLLSIIIGNR